MNVKRRLRYYTCFVYAALNKRLYWVRDNLAGPIWRKTICRRANLAASQFGGKINKNDLPSLEVTAKSFVMSQRQLKKQLKRQL